MPVRLYRPEHHEWLASFIPGHTCVEVAEEFNKRFEMQITPEKVKAYKTNHHIKSNTRHCRAKWSGPLWTKEMADFVIANNKGKTHKEMAELVSKTFHKEINAAQIKAIRGRLKIDSGLTGRFEKGHVPPNKGRKGFCSPGSEKGWFQKGHRPWNHNEVGDEAWTTDGYLKVKIAEPNKWKMKHILEWEKVNGPIPEGKMLTFLNGDHADCRPENLALITNAENLTMNHLKVRSPDPEATRAGITVAKLTRQIRKMETGK